MPQNPFKDTVVLVTGASSGIGREMARQLARQGARLVLAARRQAELEAVAAECRALGSHDVPPPLVAPTDVTEPAQCEVLIQKAMERFGRIDMLVNNAGVTMWARFDEVKDLSIYDKIIRTNYLGSVYCTYYALPHLKLSRGRIVAVSSLAGKNGVPTRSGYAASKHAMAGFFDTLRIELAGSGVSVTVAYPGFVATGVQARAFDVEGKPLGKNPIQVAKVMQTDECAAIILRAAARRRREEVMELRGKLGLWLKLVFPGLVDRIAARAIRTGR